MRIPAFLASVLLIACRQDQAAGDRGGRSLDRPVPSTGTAADARGPQRDIDFFPKRVRMDPTRLGVRRSALGPFIVDGGGRALYSFSGDDDGQSACLSACATVWPPVLVERVPLVDPSIDAGRLTLAARPDGSRQLTYGGRPLYYAEADLKSDDTWGHHAMAFGGRFTLLSPGGDPLPPPR
jgi:predicted lipoprotein with Yx(FWY)xxD motif